MRILRRLLDDESGATALEYGFLVAFVAAVLIGAAQVLAGSLGSMFSFISSQVVTASASS